MFMRLNILFIIAQLLITILTLLSSPTLLYAQSCPKNQFISSATLNQRGNSRFQNNELAYFIDKLITTRQINLSSPILDIGSGFGEATYELIRQGAKNVYALDLSEKNVTCMKEFISKSTAQKNYRLEAFSADFPYSANIDAKLKDNHFELIFSKNVIHFLSAEHLMNFVDKVAKKLKPGGIFFVSAENRFMEQQAYYYDEYFEKHSEINVNNLIKFANYAYPKFKFGNSRQHYRTCSLLTFLKTKDQYKLPMFPCQLTDVINGELRHHQLLIPETLQHILLATGLELEPYSRYSNKAEISPDIGIGWAGSIDSFYIIAKKPKLLNS